MKSRSRDGLAAKGLLINGEVKKESSLLLNDESYISNSSTSRSIFTKHASYLLITFTFAVIFGQGMSQIYLGKFRKQT